MKLKTTHMVTGLLLTLLSVNIEAGTWQAGLAAENSQSPFFGSQKETHSIPFINYIGERFSYIAGQVNYQLNPEAADNIYLLGQIRQRQYYTANLNNDDDLDIDGMSTRKSALELGIGYGRSLKRGQIIIESLIDVTGTHEGYQLTTKYSYPKQINRWMIEPSIGLQLQSADLVNYYHGVRESESKIDRPAYEGGQAINFLVGLTTAYSINTKWLALVGFEQLLLDTSILDSPFVEDEKVQKVYLGFVYTF